MKRKRIETDERVPAPATIGEARRQIEATFAENGWDARDRRVFAEMVGVEAKELAGYGPDEIKAIHARMVGARMILIKE